MPSQLSVPIENGRFSSVDLLKTHKTPNAQITEWVPQTMMHMIHENKKKMQTCASMRAFTEEGGHPIMTCGSCVAGCICTIIDVFAAVVPCPTIYTHTVVSTLCASMCHHSDRNWASNHTRWRLRYRTDLRN